MDAMTQGLQSQGHKVKIIAMATQKHPLVDGANLGDFEGVEISTQINPFSALYHLFANKSYNISRFDNYKVASKIESALKEEQFDFVILESAYAFTYVETIRNNSKAQIILRAHNVEHKIWDDLAEQTLNPLKSWYLGRLARQLEECERTMSKLVDGVVAIAKDDAVWFERAGANHVHSLPFSMSFSDTNPQNTFDHVFHLGSMDWRPNVEGVKWMIEEVWPLVRVQMPEARLVIAGRSMPLEFRSEPSMGVEVVGEVESAAEFLDRPGIATVPILSGSGMRIKAVEAMAAGLPVVGTELGIAGLGLKDGTHALIANTPKDFARSIIDLLSDPSKASTLAKNGAIHIRKTFDTKVVFKDFTSFLKNIG